MTDYPPTGPAPNGLTEAQTGLVQEAMEVLDANWLGHATLPSPGLYPHQWSWDSAFIAMAYGHFDQERAQTELLSLFRGQWRNGLLPHIVFTDAEGYFPGPEFWQVERSPDAPEGARTSGIVQPPVHATAAWRVYRRAIDRRSGSAFLEELMPKLAAWHEYLYRERTRADDGLVEIWHPWESGMDNSPLWDDALARLSPSPEDIPSYRRRDLDFARASERPTDAEYDRYAYLVRLHRELDYRPTPIREATPFAIQVVLFNSLLVQANRDLARIARVVGWAPDPFEAWAARTAAGIEARLWSEEHGLYLDHDVLAGRHLRTGGAAGFAPLYAGVPPAAWAERMVERLSRYGARMSDGSWAATSLSPEDPRFDPTRYWRGPVWPVLVWVLCRGLARYGFVAEAERSRDALIHLVRQAGFREHYDPTTGRGHGGRQFAWTAALVLDLLLEPMGAALVPADAEA